MVCFCFFAFLEHLEHFHHGSDGTFKALYDRTEMMKPNHSCKYLFRHDITHRIIHFWFVNSCTSNQLFPTELYVQITKYYRTTKVLGFICDCDGLQSLTETAERIQRHEHMVQLITALVEIKCLSFQSNHSGIDCGDEMCELLTKHQRIVLSTAFRMALIEKRSALRKLDKELHKMTSDDALLLEQYKKTIEMEFEGICHQLLYLLEHHIIKSLKQCTVFTAQRAETLVFYMKMTANYNRDLAEIFTDNVEYKEKARVYYKDAMKVARENLPTINPVLLHLALSCSVYLWDIAKKPIKARLIAKRAFDEAIGELDNVVDCDYKDVTLILQLLRDNLTLWINESEEQDLDEL